MPTNDSEHSDTPPELPDVLDYIPAIKCFEMDGVRAVCGESGIGWVADMRAYPPITEDRVLLVPVATEADHYRAVDESDRPRTQLWKADRVWIEAFNTNNGKVLAPMPTLFERLIDPDRPPSRAPIPASDIAFLAGRRLWWWHLEAFRDNYRAVSEPFEEDGEIFVRITDEKSWYRWRQVGTRPRVLDAFIQHLWAQ
ncbi:hypothetical protein [Haloglycomyces albus]|uniref:hypothetical protein n=1 Tax=Haloglycomyces albus TaxID=526067 RepID=UPI00046D7155|nr:hypothetical protein [Haloglycomyces albus]